MNLSAMTKKVEIEMYGRPADGWAEKSRAMDEAHRRLRAEQEPQPVDADPVEKIDDSDPDLPPIRDRRGKPQTDDACAACEGTGEDDNGNTPGCPAYERAKKKQNGEDASAFASQARLAARAMFGESPGWRGLSAAGDLVMSTPGGHAALAAEKNPELPPSNDPGIDPASDEGDEPMKCKECLGSGEDPNGGECMHCGGSGEEPGTGDEPAVEPEPEPKKKATIRSAWDRKPWIQRASMDELIDARSRSITNAAYQTEIERRRALPGFKVAYAEMTHAQQAYFYSQRRMHRRSA